MWDSLSSPSSVKPKPTIPFADWLDQYVLNDVYLRKGRELLGVAEVVHPIFSKLATTIQTPPHHSEGPFVKDGIVRALAGLYAIADGANGESIEELIREKHLEQEVRDLFETIHEHVASLSVYLLCHDLGKIETLVLDAPLGSRGEVEGFYQHAYRLKRQATEEERRLYGKLFKAYQAQHAAQTLVQQTAGFFDLYEIHAHYPEHEKAAIALLPDFFDPLCDHFRLQPRERSLVRFAIREHMRLMVSLSSGDAVRAYELLLTRAHRDGLDGDDAMDFLLAASFLDGCVGSLPYKEGEWKPSVHLIYKAFSAEEQVAPHRRAKRREREGERKEKALRFALKEAGLDGVALFDLLQTPFGRERGVIAHEIRTFVLHPELPITFPTHKEEIARRIGKARALLT